MISFKRFRLAPAFVLGGLLALAVAGCGASTTTTSTTTGSASTATTSTTSPALVATANVTVGGVAKTALTDAKGNTLYYFTPDTATKVACTATCAGIWPPLLLPSGAPTSSATLPSKLDTLDSGNGRQVIYNGHPLYTYSKDTGPGQTNGEGVAGKWHVATTDLGVQTAGISGY